jgi:hypothetical protein
MVSTPNDDDSSGDDSSAAPYFCKGIALAVKAFRDELKRLRLVAEKAEISDGCRLIKTSLRELKLEYGDVQLGRGDSGVVSLDGFPTERLIATGNPRSPRGVEVCADLGQVLLAYGDLPNTDRAGLYADASVGTDDVDAHSAAGRPSARRMTAAQVLSALDLGIPSAMEIELTPHRGARMFDVQCDLVSFVCGRSAAALAIRLRWACIAIGLFGAVVPTSLVFAVHWATGGLGQFGPAYAWPFWLDVWICVGWWLSVGVLLLWYASLQRELAWMALKQFSTIWIIAMTGVWTAAWVSLYDFGVHRSTWVVLPSYIGCALFPPLIAMADALPPKMRLRALRFAGPLALGCLGTAAVVLRLPTAKGTPGELMWTVMGIDTVTNLQALAYSATVLTVLLAEGSLRAWVFPNELAFIQTGLKVTERANCAPVSGGLREVNTSHGAPVASVSLTASSAASAARARVAPHPFDPSLLG